MSPTLDQIRAVPKVLLHDHLDGGLRPSTVIELAEETGYRDLPVARPGRAGEDPHRRARTGVTSTCTWTPSGTRSG